MTEQHECVWKIDLARRGYYCVVGGCLRTLLLNEAELRLNEYEALKAENVLALAQMDEAIDEYGKAQAELETLKKATYALRHDLASWLSLARRQYKEMETNNPICPHLRGINETERLLNVELTKPDDILEGK